MRRDRPIESIRKSYDALLKLIREKSPTSNVYLCTIPPTRDFFSNQRILELNAYLQRMAHTDSSIHCLSPAPSDVNKYFNFDRFYHCFIHMNMRGKRLFVKNLLQDISSIQNFHVEGAQIPP